MENSTDSQNVKTCTKKPYSLSRIFWGFLLVLVGTLIILNNFEIVHVNWNNLWRLWPMIIIITGLSMLSLKGWLWRVVTILAIIISMAVIVWASVFWRGSVNIEGNKINFSNFNLEKFQ